MAKYNDFLKEYILQSIYNNSEPFKTAYSKMGMIAALQYEKILPEDLWNQYGNQIVQDKRLSISSGCK